jgi:hypothetical protein
MRLNKGDFRIFEKCKRFQQVQGRSQRPEREKILTQRRKGAEMELEAPQARHGGRPH